MNKFFEAIGTPDGIKELFVAGICFVLAWGIKWLLSARMEKERVGRVARFVTGIIKLIKPIYVPLFAQIFLAIGSVIAGKYIAEPVILPVILKITFIWLALGIVQIFTKSAFVWWTVALLTTATVSLSMLNLLGPLAEILDSYSFSLGKVKISLLKVIKLIFTLCILFWSAGILSKFIESYVKKIKALKTRSRELIIKAFQALLYFTIFLTILNILDIDLTALAVFSGAIGVGIGLGLQKIASNFISGIVLLFEDSVQLGDLVEIDGGISGIVKHAGTRYTLIELFDGREVMIPNEEFITQRIINWTLSNSKGRVEIKVGVGYNSDLEKAKQIMLECACGHPRCSKDTEPLCFLSEFGDSSVNFLLYFWVDDVIEGRLGPKSDVMFSIWKKFKENNIEIPFPQRDIHIKNADALTRNV